MRIQFKFVSHVVKVENCEISNMDLLYIYIYIKYYLKRNYFYYKLIIIYNQDNYLKICIFYWDKSINNPQVKESWKKGALYVIIINIQLWIIIYYTFQKEKYAFQQFVGFYTKYIVVGCIFLDICSLMNSNWSIGTYYLYKYLVEGENMKLLDQDLLSARVTY